MTNKIENFLHQNFVSVCNHFLSFEINRLKFAVQTLGSGNAYLIFQVIVWHHILAMINEAETKIRDEAVDIWFKLTKTWFKSSTVLIYSLISFLTSLSLKTVRRDV